MGCLRLGSPRSCSMAFPAFQMKKAFSPPWLRSRPVRFAKVARPWPGHGGSMTLLANQTMSLWGVSSGPFTTPLVKGWNSCSAPPPPYSVDGRESRDSTPSPLSSNATTVCAWDIPRDGAPAPARENLPSSPASSAAAPTLWPATHTTAQPPPARDRLASAPSPASFAGRKG
jgi:hypothetical protein